MLLNFNTVARMYYALAATGGFLVGVFTTAVAFTLADDHRHVGT